MCIDEPELRLATNNYDKIEKIIKSQLLKLVKCDNITCEGEGVSIYINSKSLNACVNIRQGNWYHWSWRCISSSIISLYSIKTDQLIISLISNIVAALKVDILGHSQPINEQTILF